jgi:hypothetical protein
MTLAQDKKEPREERPRDVTIVAHSMLFYWWPVWAVGLLMAGLTWLDGHCLAVVPAGTRVVENYDGDREALVLPAGAHLPTDPDTGKPREPSFRVARHSAYGVIFVVVFLLVLFITNVPLRGLWSLVMIVTLLLGTVILAWADLWDNILEAMVHSHIYINAFGYLAIAVPLLILWLLVVLFFDRQTHMVFAPGQLRVRQEIGGGEAAYDTTGMVVAKQRSGLFRHWLLGVGSGDLLVKPSGANAQQFEVHNVLFVGKKLQLIQQMLQTREVVRGR